MKIGMLFPGYGSQYVGMGKDIYDESRIMQEYFEEASNCLDKNFVKLVFASSDAELRKMENAYTSLFLMSSALAAILKEQGIVPDVVAGYGFGEFAAIHAGGGISLPDGLYLLSKFVTYYQALLPTVEVAGITVSGISREQADDMILKASKDDKRAYIAFQTTPSQFTFMGDADAVEYVRGFAETTPGATVEEAPQELGLHSAIMDPVVANFRMYLEKVDFKDLAMPLMSNADAKLISLSDELKTAVIKQVHSPVMWTDIMDAFIDCDVIIVVGPNEKLAAIVREIYPGKQILIYNKKTDLEEIKNSIQQPTEQLPQETEHGE